MRRSFPSVLGLSLILSTGLAAQGDAAAAASKPAAAARKTGAIWKSEIDALIGALGDSARGKTLPALGGDDVLATAKVLTAMARCHRRYYHPNDVPVVSRSVEFLIQKRQQDGSFGSVAATTWTMSALAELPLEPTHFAAEIAAAKAWLAGQDAEERGFDGVLQQQRAMLRADRFPQHLGGPAAESAKAWIASKGAAGFAVAADALVQLVACQVLNLELDRAAAPQAVATWSLSQQRALAWLMTQQKDGVFSVSMGGQSFPDPALTGFGLLALQCKPKAMRTAAEQTVIDKGMRWLIAGQNEDGTFGERVPNYTTCVVVGALHKWGDPSIEPVMQKAQRAVLAFQNSESNGYQSGDRDYGSIGYGSSQRGDLSNLNFSLQALRESGLPANHEAFQKALVFLQRTQNLKTVNDFQGKVPDPDRPGVVLDATAGDDGGATYYPGNSAAGYEQLPDGKSVPRSYGSMTYALLKCYTLCGLPGSDPRVQAAVQWIGANWTVAENPGADPKLGDKARYQGLYYYYLLLAQALDAAGIEQVAAVADGKTTPTDWRAALRSQLESLQRADGAWINDRNGRWYEGLDILCTCYALLALDACK
jgi:squalene-hopene/tetraprenyl-beta-curcumene cyclase